MDARENWTGLYESSPNEYCETSGDHPCFPWGLFSKSLPPLSLGFHIPCTYLNCQQLTSEAAVAPLHRRLSYSDIRIWICPAVATPEELAPSPHSWRRKSEELPERSPPLPPSHPAAASLHFLSTLPPAFPYLLSCLPILQPCEMTTSCFFPLF